jgi:hypothetical protein
MCVNLGLRKYLLNVVGILVVDVVLLMSMLIGLLRYPHSSSTGLWHYLYQQVALYYLSYFADC